MSDALNLEGQSQPNAGIESGAGRATHESHKLISVASVIRDDVGRILLVKQTYGHLNWELPGGRVESGETVVDAAVREVKEETGLEVVVDRLTGLYDELDDDFLHLVFTGHLRGAEARIRIQPTEVSACDFWPVDALPRPISDYTLRRISDALSGTAYPTPFVLRERRWLE